MGVNTLATIAAGSRLYLDTNIWIYALEGFAGHAQALAQLFARIDAGELTAITSELTLAEALVKPFSTRRTELQQVYLDTLSPRATVEVAPVSRSILIAAARLRAEHTALKLPDAIHAATALEHGASSFITSDARFATVTGLNAIVLAAQ